MAEYINKKTLLKHVVPESPNAEFRCVPLKDIMEMPTRVIKTKSDEVAIGQKDFGLLCICAIRYCHGRQTYMPSMIQGICKKYLRKLSDHDIKIMLEDCDFQRRCQLYGDEHIDKPDWLRWEEALLTEQKRREGKS